MNSEFPFYGYSLDEIMSWEDVDESTIREFGLSIGIELPRINTEYSMPFQILHELSHWAVCPDFLIKDIWEIYRKDRMFYCDLVCSTLSHIPSFSDAYLPNTRYFAFAPSNRNRWNAESKIIRNLEKLIPNEYACQIWQAQVSVKHKWKNTITKYPHNSIYFGDSIETLNNTLSRVGIDVLNESYRPKIDNIYYSPKHYKTFACYQGKRVLSLDWSSWTKCNKDWKIES